MRSTCLRAAISCFALSKTGLDNHGSTSRIFPPGVTILKADWPYHVSCVSMLITKLKRARSARGDQQNEEGRGPLVTWDMRLDDLTIEPCEAIRHFILASHHEPCTGAPSHFKESPAHGAVNQTIAAIRDHPGRFDPRVRCAGRIDRLSAAERKGGGDHLGP